MCSLVCLWLECTEICHALHHQCTLLSVFLFKTQPDTPHQLAGLLRVSCAKKKRCPSCQKVARILSNATSAFFSLIGWTVLIIVLDRGSSGFSLKNFDALVPRCWHSLLVVVLATGPSLRPFSSQSSCDTTFQLPCKQR